MKPVSEPGPVRLLDRAAQGRHRQPAGRFRVRQDRGLTDGHRGRRPRRRRGRRRHDRGAGLRAARASMFCSARSRRRSAAPPRPPPARSGCRAPSRRVEAGFKDDIPEARRYLNSIIGPATDGRREAYLATGPELVDYLAPQQRGEVLALRQASGLSVEPSRHDARRPRAGAAAVRRPAARRGFRAAAPADRRVHGARRHDDRPRRHRAAGAAVRIGCELSPRAVARCGGTPPTACATAAARGC